MISLISESLADPNPSNRFEVEYFRGRLLLNDEPGPVVSIRAHEIRLEELGVSDAGRAGAALQIALPQLVGAAESGQLLELDNGEAVIVIQLGDEEFDAAARRLRSKACWYQKGDDPVLICSAAPPADSQVTASDCIRCAIPPSGVLCRWCAHVEIQTGRRDGMGRVSSWAPSAKCGRPAGPAPDAQRSIGPQCGPSGNSCWEILLADPSLSARQLPVSASEVLQLFDHLDTVWRLQPGQARLFGPGSLHQVAAVLEPVASFNDFRSAVNDLVQLINRASPAGSSSGRHLARVEEILAEYSERGERAVRALRSVVNFRAKLEHSPRERSLAANEVGLTYPGDSWASTWAQLLGITADATRTIIREIKTHVDEGEA